MSYTMSPDEVSADLDTERIDRFRQLQNGGSDLEPLERMSLLQVFREGCAIWYGWRDDPCVKARRSVYAALCDRHDPDAVIWWQHRIEAILDAAEAEVYAIVRDGCPLCVSHVLRDETVGLAYATGGRRVHTVVYGGGGHSCQRPCLSRHGAEKKETNGT